MAPTEMEAELICGLLRTAGIRCDHRKTNVAAGAWRGDPGAGPREILVDASDLDAARETLATVSP